MVMAIAIGPTPSSMPTAYAPTIIYAGTEIRHSLDGAHHATYAIDPGGRLMGANYADDYFFAFERDDHGRVIKGKTPDCEVAVEHDDRGRVVSETQDGRVLHYEYNAEGQLARVTLPDGKTFEYEYDLDGRVNLARDSLGQTQRFRYDRAERPVRRELPSGLIEDYALDIAGRISNVELHAGGARI